MVTAAILAGGHATRLGGADKSALVIDGETILARLRRQLESVTPQVVLVGGTVRGSHASGLPIVPDRYLGAGPLAGIHAALAEAPSSHVLVLACDLPFVTGSFLTHLTRLRDRADAVVPRDAHGRRHPLCAVYAAGLAPAVAACLDAGRRRVTDLLDAITVHLVDVAALPAFGRETELLTNVNTPDDYRRAAAGSSDGAPLRA